jgi:hypothetical protein
MNFRTCFFHKWIMVASVSYVTLRMLMLMPEIRLLLALK